MAEANSSMSSETKSKINPDEYLFVIALDFGTTYSGYAFSSRSEFEDNPLKIQNNQEWIASGTSLLSLKTPTSLLIKKDGDFVAFGYEAEDKFYAALENESHKDLMLFRRFKMKLYNKMGINESLLIEDVTGEQFQGKHIFTIFLKALADHFKTSIQKQKLTINLRHDLKWVLTVPAIWSEAAKKFMRHCAIDAGIPDEMLMIALEPEAASIYAKYLPIERYPNGFGMTKDGTRYMVVDIGGGTADITVHEKVKGGKLRELHQATGGACGGTAVDAAFESRLNDILGEKVMKRLQEKKTETYLDIFREFEIAKRALHPNKTDTIRMTISFVSLNELCQEIEKKTLTEMFENVEGMYIKGDKLHIDVETMKQFFKPSITELINHMQSIMENPQADGISMILLVGGSADSKHLKSEVEKAFDSVQLIVPPEAGLAVLRGAVIFGHCPTVIMSRILRFTYGTAVGKEFDPAIHREDKKVTIDDKDMCVDCFSTIISAGTEIEIGHKEMANFSTTSYYQELATVKIFCSPHNEVQYTDDEGCFKLGELSVSLDGDIMTHDFDVIFVFGDTELQVMAIEHGSSTLSACTLKMNEES